MCVDMMMLHCVALLSITLLHSLVLAEVITISPNSLCPESEPMGNSSCITLSQYAVSTTNKPNSTENVVLHLIPGNHTLDSNLSVSNWASFMLLANTSLEANTTITCGSLAMILFRDIQIVHLNNMEFIGCVSNVVESVETFVLENCTFQGANGNAFYILDTANVQIDRSVFNSFAVNKSNTGGVLTVYSSNISVVNSLFSNNVAIFGGVISVASDSNVTVDSSSFHSSLAEIGGILYVQSSEVTITNCEISNNSAHSLGGVVYANTSVITFSRTVCHSANSVRGGVVFADESTIVFQESNISNNYGGRGSVGYANFTTIIAVNSVFTMNEASRGGVFYGNFGEVSLTDCNCTQNRADRGGVIYMFNSTVMFENTTSDGNVAPRGGAIYAFTRCRIIMYNSIFTRHSATRIGGLVFALSAADVSIVNCIVSRNEAATVVIYVEDKSMLYISTSTFSNNVAGRSGGILSVEFVKLHINESVFRNNSSPVGVMSISRSSMTTHGRCVYAKNSGSIILLNSNATFTGVSEFYSNTHRDEFTDGISGAVSELGGAITCILSDVVFSGDTSFEHNHGVRGGAIVALQCRLYLNDDFSITNNTVDSTGGGIYASLSSLKFRGTSTIMSNVAQDRGGGIHAISASVELFLGTLLVSDNSASAGGGIYLEQSAKLFVIKEDYEYILGVRVPVRLEFSSNMAEYGGAIYVSDNSTSGTCASSSKMKLSSECFIQTLQAHTNLRVNNSLIIKNMFFANNFANRSGNIVYGGLLDRCMPSPNAEVVVNNKLSNPNPLIYLFTITNITDFTGIESDPLRVCFCVEIEGDIVPDCSYIPQNITVMKGERFSLPAVAVDQTNKTLPATIRSTLSSKRSGLNEGQLLQQTIGTCSTLQYNIVSLEESVDLLLFADGPCRDLGRSQRSVKVVFKSCKCGIGFQHLPSTSTCECVCHSKLTEYITECQNNMLLRSMNFWIDYTNVTEHTCIVLYPSCPYDYCITPNTLNSETNDSYINLNIPDGADSQCAFNRTGLLCGSCKDNLSLMLGTSRCMQCSNNWIALLILFMLSGIFLVSFILILNLTVAIGTISGLIFYANVVAANRAIFLPFTQPAKFFFISWLNLDWGFETCFFNGMDAYSKTWLQFVFPFYIFFIVIAMIAISERSYRFSKLLAGRNPVATLATLILLSYTKLLRTIIAALSYADLECIDGSGTRRVWLFDANVRYLEGKHIPLFIAAIIVVIFGLLYTFLLLFGQWLPLLPRWKVFKSVKSTRFNSFIEAYHAPYHPRHRYWVGLLLLVRVFLYLVSAYNATGNPYISLYSVVFTISCLLVLRDISRTIYKNWAIGVLETSFLFNLLIFSGATLYVQDAQGSQEALAYTSVYITFLLLLGILVYHLHIQFFKSTTKFYKIAVEKMHKVMKNNHLKYFSTKNENGQKNAPVTEDISLHVIANEHPDEVTERYHEPLLDDEHSGSYVLVNPSLTPPTVTHSVIDGVSYDGAPPLSTSVKTAQQHSQ